jgi:hypothetical protein
MVSGVAQSARLASAHTISTLKQEPFSILKHLFESHIKRHFFKYKKLHLKYYFVLRHE